MAMTTLARLGQESAQFSQAVEHWRQRSPSQAVQPLIRRIPFLAMASALVM